jgi:hypothetical protein
LYNFIGNLPYYFRRRHLEDFADPADRWETDHLTPEHLRKGLMSNTRFDTDLNLSHLGFDYRGCEALRVYDQHFDLALPWR